MQVPLWAVKLMPSPPTRAFGPFVGAQSPPYKPPFAWINLMRSVWMYARVIYTSMKHTNITQIQNTFLKQTLGLEKPTGQQMWDQVSDRFSP